MTRDDIISMAREAWDRDTDPWLTHEQAFLERFYRLAHAAGEQAERDRTARLVQDMQAELQALRDRLARQRPVLWVFKDNPGLTTMTEPKSDLWEPLGNIV